MKAGVAYGEWAERTEQHVDIGAVGGERRDEPFVMHEIARGPGRMAHGDIRETGADDLEVGIVYPLPIRAVVAFIDPEACMVPRRALGDRRPDQAKLEADRVAMHVDEKKERQ